MKQAVCGQLDKVIGKSDIISTLIKSVIVCDVLLGDEQKATSADIVNFKNRQTVERVGEVVRRTVIDK